MLTETTMVQLIVLSYPLLFSMLHSGGINHNKMVSTNIVKLKLQTLIKIHPVVNISQVVRYRKLVVSRLLMVDFIHFYFFSFILIFLFLYFLFSIFRTTQVRGYQSHCHISHKLMA